MVGDRKCLPENLSKLLEAQTHSDVLTEVTSTVSKALLLLESKGYDAAVLWIERPDELSGVIRIRKVEPDLPILVLAPHLDPAFASLARQAGATRTASSSRDAGVVSEEIGRAVVSGELLEELRAQARWSLAQARELHELAKETTLRMKQARALLPSRATTFAPIIVEDDPDMVDLLREAFRKAGMPEPAAVLNTGEALIRLLTETAEDYALGRRPFPSLILVDLVLPGKSGIEVVEWIRAQPNLPRIPVIMFSTTADPERINRSYQAGANSYLMKPTNFDSLVEMVRGLKLYWGAMNQLPGP